MHILCVAIMWLMFHMSVLICGISLVHVLDYRKCTYKWRLKEIVAHEISVSIRLWKLRDNGPTARPKKWVRMPECVYIYTVPCLDAETKEKHSESVDAKFDC